eukprot:3595579-Pyramimonas_sp.AAC.1
MGRAQSYTVTDLGFVPNSRVLYNLPINSLREAQLVDSDLPVPVAHPQLAVGARDEARVVADQHHPPLEGVQAVDERLHALHVEVVGGLVQNHDVRGLRRVSKTAHRHVSKTGQHHVSKTGQRHVSKTGQHHVSKTGQRHVSKTGQCHVSKTGQRHVGAMSAKQ